MGSFLVVVLFLVGIVLIVKGGDLFVDAASWIAEISGIPKLIIGATVVSLATTLPEMFVSVIAASQGKVDMAIGNAVGSVTANLGLIMAISLLALPAVIRRREYMPKFVLMLIAAGILVIGGIFGKVNLFLSVALLAVFAVFAYENVRSAVLMTRTEKSLAAKTDTGTSETGKTPAKEKLSYTKKDIVINLIKFAVGAVGIVGGANLLVDNGSELARLVGVSERIIGVTVVAVGTSLPELVTTVTAIVKKQSSLSVGNILGANILDLTLILPLSALISGKALPVSHSSAVLDLPVSLLVGLIAIVPTMISSRFRRWQGVVLLAVYAVYVGITCFVMT